MLWRQGARGHGVELFGEEFLQRSQGRLKRFRVCSAEALNEPRFVQRLDLIQQNEASAAFKHDRNSIWRMFARAGHRCDDNGSHIIVHFVRGNHDARPRLSQLAPDRRIESCQPDVAPRYHSTSESASLANSGQTKASSPAAAIALLATAQPSRTLRSGFRSTIAPCSISISTSFVSPNCASNALGRITPRELPIR